MNVTCFASHARGSCSGSNPEKVVLRNATAGVNFGALGAKSAFPAPKSMFWAQKGVFSPKVVVFLLIFAILCSKMLFGAE